MSIEKHKFSDGGLIARVADDDNVALYDIITNDKFGISKDDAYALAKHFGLIDEWVSVDEELPPLGKCIVSDGKGLVTEMTYTKNKWAKTEKGRAPRFEWCGKISPWVIKSWKPMPTPPKGE